MPIIPTKPRSAEFSLCRTILTQAPPEKGRDFGALAVLWASMSQQDEYRGHVRAVNATLLKQLVDTVERKSQTITAYEPYRELDLKLANDFRFGNPPAPYPLMDKPPCNPVPAADVATQRLNIKPFKLQTASAVPLCPDPGLVVPRARRSQLRLCHTCGYFITPEHGRQCTWKPRAGEIPRPRELKTVSKPCHPFSN